MPIPILTRTVRLAVIAVTLLALGAPVAAKDSLGVFGQWGAFRDPSVPRCYAIAAPQDARAGPAYASVGTWPQRGVRGQLHVRLSRGMATGSAVSLSLGGQRFALTGAGGDAWARDRRMDAAIVAAMRSAGAMSISAQDSSGRRFTDRYSLAGAATAMDAATVGCARVR
ncbi:MAG TPA: invasion associated locus B family protein [Croceibacterium sp.]|nr:invasion associated locus B family protein [Croceibacterium sp.]